MARTAQQTVTKERARRRSRDANMGGFQKRLAIPANLVNNADYIYRWVNDEGTRLSGAVANDYDFANETGDEVDQRSTDRAKVHVGSLPNGEPLLAYLMRKRKKWHDSDKEELQTGIDENMKSIKLDAESPSDNHRYKPGKSIQID